MTKKSKISYNTFPHSTSSMLKIGTYDPSLTKEDVRTEVNGSFGGRFEYFEGGKFKFIAYTD